MLRRSAISAASSGVYLDGLPVFLMAMGASLPCDGATPWLVVVLGFAGRLGGLAVVSGMVNPYSYAGQCNKLLVTGLDSGCPATVLSVIRPVGTLGQDFIWVACPSTLHQHGWRLACSSGSVYHGNMPRPVSMRVSCWWLASNPAHSPCMSLFSPPMPRLTLW